LKLLVGGAKTKIFHLKEFCDALAKFGVEYRLVYDVDIYDGFPSRNFKHWFQTRRKFNELIRNFKPDVIFIDRQRHFALSATETKIPTYMLLRGDYWYEMKSARDTLYKTLPRRLALFQWDKIAQKCFKNSTMILPICKYLDEIVHQHYPHKKTSVLYGGIDASRWYPVEEMELKHPCVGLLQGAWIWGKAKEMLTLAKVMEAMPDVMFYWAGDGPYRDRVLAVLSKYENFKWLGSLEYPDKVREYLASIDVYALMSGLDMSPLTLQEAQLMKKPVVVTNAGGISELMMDKETGFLVKKGDHNDWIKKLTLLINDKKLAETMGSSGRKFVEDNFSWERMAKEFLKIVQDHINKK